MTDGLKAKHRIVAIEGRAALMERRPYSEGDRQ